MEAVFEVVYYDACRDEDRTVIVHCGIGACINEVIVEAIASDSRCGLSFRSKTIRLVDISDPKTESTASSDGSDSSETLSDL